MACGVEQWNFDFDFGLKSEILLLKDHTNSYVQCVVPVLVLINLIVVAVVAVFRCRSHFYFEYNIQSSSDMTPP